MGFVEIWGWVCAFAGAISALPQVVRLVRARTSAGVSLLNWQLVCGTNLAWIAHGYFAQAVNIMVTNVFVGAAAASIVALVARDRRLPMVRTMVPIIGAVCLACIGVEVFLWAVVFGLVIGLPQLVGGVFQLRDLLTSRLVTGVSAGFLVLGVVVQALWVSWALMVHEGAVIIAGGSMGLLTLVNLAVYVLRRLGVPAIGRPSPDAGPQPTR